MNNQFAQQNHSSRTALQLDHPLEILAPGGSIESMKAAVRAGADAVYMGGSMFSARAYAKNPETEDMIGAIDYCHLHGRKLYLTVNTLLKDKEITNDLYRFLAPLYEAGLDAVLVQDMGVFSFIKENFQDLPLHASTQMSVQSVDGALRMQKLGAERIVPARELSLKEIREIYDATGMEIECFIHGALCYSYSGQCLMSSLIGGRSGNRGRCAQPCRKEYTLFDSKGNVLSDQKNRYLLSLKDICTLDLIPELIGAGVCSFKIEGRMKRAEYAAGVVSVYRKYIDQYVRDPAGYKGASQEDMLMLQDLYNRGGFSNGYYHRMTGSPDMMTMSRPNHAGIPAAKVLPDGRLKALRALSAGDLLELKEEKGKGQDRKEVSLSSPVSKGAVFTLEKGGKQKLAPGRIVPRVKNEKLLKDISDRYIKEEIQEKIKGKFILKQNEPAILTVFFGDKALSAAGDLPQIALNKSTTVEEVRKQLLKTGGTAFVFESLEIDMEDGLFFPVSSLNALRREVLSKLESHLVTQYRRVSKENSYDQKDQMLPVKEEKSGEKVLISAHPHTLRQAEVLMNIPQIDRIYLDADLWMDGDTKNMQCAFATAEKIRQAEKECVLALPYLWRAKVRERFNACFQEKDLLRFDGILLRFADQAEVFAPLCKMHGLKVYADAGLYTFNRYAKAYWKEAGIDQITLPLELNSKELKALEGCGGEMIVYGYQPIMFTAQCLKKNTSGCSRQNAFMLLRDETGARFPVQAHCGSCMNVIYNSLPLDLTGEETELRKIAPLSIRLTFLRETEEEIRSICRRSASLFTPKGEKMRSGEAVSQKQKNDSTRGHFRRGVE